MSFLLFKKYPDLDQSKYCVRKGSIGGGNLGLDPLYKINLRVEWQRSSDFIRILQSGSGQIEDNRVI